MEGIARHNTGMTSSVIEEPTPSPEIDVFSPSSWTSCVPGHDRDYIVVTS
jgi:hypothetical protein